MAPARQLARRTANQPARPLKRPARPHVRPLAPQFLHPLLRSMREAPLCSPGAHPTPAPRRRCAQPAALQRLGAVPLRPKPSKLRHRFPSREPFRPTSYSASPWSQQQKRLALRAHAETPSAPALCRNASQKRLAETPRAANRPHRSRDHLHSHGHQRKAGFSSRLPGIACERAAGGRASGQASVRAGGRRARWASGLGNTLQKTFRKTPISSPSGLLPHPPSSLLPPPWKPPLEGVAHPGGTSWWGGLRCDFKRLGGIGAGNQELLMASMKHIFRCGFTQVCASCLPEHVFTTLPASLRRPSVPRSLLPLALRPVSLSRAPLRAPSPTVRDCHSSNSAGLEV